MEDPVDGTFARFEGRAMGSPLRLTFAGDWSPLDAQDCWRLVVEEFEAAEDALSRFRDASELTRLNKTAGSGDVVHPSDRLRRALTASDRAHRVTRGRFDPRVLVDLDRLGYRGAALGVPLPNERPATARTLGHIVEAVGRRGRSISGPVDLGGIGKGLTLRWAAGLLVRAGARDFLLEAGGDLVAHGHDPDGTAWQVGIEDPAGNEEPLAVIAVTDLAVATSSTRVHRWTVGGRAVHHLLDPRTGEPADGGLAAVTVAGSDPAWAEVWSKTLFLGGRAAIASDARSRGLAAWWVADDATLEMTAAARALTIWVAAEAD